MGIGVLVSLLGLVLSFPYLILPYPTIYSMLPYMVRGVRGTPMEYIVG